MSRWLTFSFFGLLCVGCAKPNKERCNERLQAARTEMSQGRLTEAEHILAEAYSRCRSQSVAEVQQLRQQLAEKRRQRRLDEARQANRQAEQERAQHPTLGFVHWALDHRGALPAELTEPECAQRGEPGFGFCEAVRPGFDNMRVRYWENDPTAARYSLVTEEPPSCQDVGEHRPLPTWTSNGASHTLCELTERKYRQFSALLVSKARENRMYLFSRAYLQHDPEFARRISPAGAPR